MLIVVKDILDQLLKQQQRVRGTQPVGEISDVHIYVCDNCGHREPKAVPEGIHSCIR